MTQKIGIGERLVQYGYINEEQLENSLSLQKGTQKQTTEYEKISFTMPCNFMYWGCGDIGSRG